MHRAGFIAALVLLAAFGSGSLIAQQTVTIEGTLVDSKCFLGMGERDNDHGAMAGCGTACLKTGLPAGLVTSDGTFHVLVAPAHDLAGHVGHTVRVTGSLTNGALVATKAEMNANGRYSEIKLGSMM